MLRNPQLSLGLMKGRRRISCKPNHLTESDLFLDSHGMAPLQNASLVRVDCCRGIITFISTIHKVVVAVVLCVVVAVLVVVRCVLCCPRDPSIQVIPTLGSKVCNYYLHWAVWIPRVGKAEALWGQDANSVEKEMTTTTLTRRRTKRKTTRHCGGRR